MTCYQIKSIEFLTQLPDNDFLGDSSLNLRLQKEWRGDIIECESLPEWHLDEVLDFVEDNSGCLVSSIYVNCIGKVPKDVPASITRKITSKDCDYPLGWVWFRSACRIEN